MNYNNLERFIAFSTYNCIKELEFSDLYRNFKVLQESEKYSNVLDYDFDVDGKSLKLDSEINKAIEDNYALKLSNTYLYNIMTEKQVTDIVKSVEDKALYLNMVKDYINTNDKIYQKKKSI